MAVSEGNCYLCGEKLGKTAMKTHLLKTHNIKEEQKCYLLKIEAKDNKNYWLYIDIPVDRKIENIDRFLRNIWLECCGHLSEFKGLTKSDKLSTLSVGETFLHEYDFGSTTETVITIVGKTTRKKQRNTVRLLARNIPPALKCAVCGSEAVAICVECAWESDEAFYCEDCIDEHEHEMLLPVTNSPRMGVCGYDGSLDEFEFDTDKMELQELLQSVQQNKLKKL